MSLKSWLQHAFAVETKLGKVSDSEQRVVQQICHEVVRRRMVTPAITFLEMARPLNYLGSQTMQFFMPIISVLSNGDDIQIFVNFLERRDAIDILINEIERHDKE